MGRAAWRRSGLNKGGKEILFNKILCSLKLNNMKICANSLIRSKYSNVHKN